MNVEVEIDLGSKDSTHAARQRRPSRRALVVDDEPETCGLIQVVLGLANIEALILPEIAQIDERIQEEKFEVILIGLCGTTDGINLIRKLRSSGFNQKTPIIVISNDQSPDALPQGFQAGATFFAYKPIDKARLKKLLRVAKGAIEHEKRRFRRVPVRTNIRVRLGEVVIVGETVDLSLNGTLVNVPKIFPLQSRVEFALSIASGKNPVLGKGSVVRILNGNQMGILFDHLPFAESARLQEYLLPMISR